MWLTFLISRIIFSARTPDGVPLGCVVHTCGVSDRAKSSCPPATDEFLNGLNQATPTAANLPVTKAEKAYFNIRLRIRDARQIDMQADTEADGMSSRALERHCMSGARLGRRSTCRQTPWRMVGWGGG